MGLSVPNLTSPHPHLSTSTEQCATVCVRVLTTCSHWAGGRGVSPAATAQHGEPSPLQAARCAASQNPAAVESKPGISLFSQLDDVHQQRFLKTPPTPPTHPPTHRGQGFMSWTSGHRLRCLRRLPPPEAARATGGRAASVPGGQKARRGNHGAIAARRRGAEPERGAAGGRSGAGAQRLDAGMQGGQCRYRSARLGCDGVFRRASPCSATC